jgi:hypothetical protein
MIEKAMLSMCYTLAEAPLALVVDEQLFCRNGWGVTLETLKRYVEGQKNR